MATGSGATITGVVGPGITLTTGVFRNVTDVQFDFVKQSLRIVSDYGISHIDISADTTITLTVSSGVYTLTISA